MVRRYESRPTVRPTLSSLIFPYRSATTKATDVHRRDITDSQAQDGAHDERDRLGLGLPLRPPDLAPLAVPAPDVPDLMDLSGSETWP